MSAEASAFAGRESCAWPVRVKETGGRDGLAGAAVSFRAELPQIGRDEEEPGVK